MLNYLIFYIISIVYNAVVFFVSLYPYDYAFNERITKCQYVGTFKDRSFDQPEK